MRPSSPGTVLVVGASSGIGRAAAAMLARRGHRVFGSSRARARIDLDGVEPVELDVRDGTSVNAAVDGILARADGIDAVVYSAGFYVAGAVEETTPELAYEQLEGYLVGAHRVVRAVLPSMRARRRGRLVLMSSTAAVGAIPFHAMYSASKAALEHYAEALRSEVLPFGIHVPCTQATWIPNGRTSERSASA